MAHATWLADVLRAEGLDVIEAPGWRTRGGLTFNPQGIVVHHTANPDRSDAPSLNLCIKGRSDLPGPLCNVLLSRSGVCHLIAAGTANHAGKGSWRDLRGNSTVVGIEAENNGRGEKWPAVQLDAFHRACAAILRHLNRDESWCVGHKEWTPRKIDPAGIDMDAFRASVAALLNQEEDMAQVPQDEWEQVKAAVLKMAPVVDRLDENANFRMDALRASIEGLYGRLQEDARQVRTGALKVIAGWLGKTYTPPEG